MNVDNTLIALQEMGRLGIDPNLLKELKEEPMTDNQRKFVGESWIELQDSLLEAVDEAGGANGPYKYDLIKGMTVGEFFNRIATKHIRFICVKEKT